MALFLLVIFSLVGTVTIFGAFGIDTQSGGSDFVRVGGIAVCSIAGLLAWGGVVVHARIELELQILSEEIAFLEPVILGRPRDFPFPFLKQK